MLPDELTTCYVCYTSVDCSFREQHFINKACMELCHLWEITFSESLWLEVGRWASDVGGTVGPTLATARLLVISFFCLHIRQSINAAGCKMHTLFFLAVKVKCGLGD